MKILLIILGSLFALAVIGVVIVSLFLGTVVTKGVNTFAPKLIGTAVTVDGVSMSPLTGSGTLTGLFVGNPSGWKSDKAFSFGKLHVSVAPTSLLGGHIVLNEILIDNPSFVYETKAVASNIKDMLINLEKKLGVFSPLTPGELPVTPEAGSIRFAVKSFRLGSGTVIKGVGPDAIAVPVPSLVLTELGVKEGGITPDQLLANIMAAVLANITKAVADADASLPAEATTDAPAPAKSVTTDTIPEA